MHVNVCMSFEVKVTLLYLKWSTSPALHYTGNLSEDNRNQHLMYVGARGFLVKEKKYQRYIEESYSCYLSSI